MKKKTQKKKATSSSSIQRKMSKKEEAQLVDVLKIVDEIYRAKNGVDQKVMQGVAIVIKRNSDGTWFMSSSMKNATKQILLHTVCSLAGMSYLDGAIALTNMSKSQEELEEKKKKK
jgi:hypothetical protein